MTSWVQLQQCCLEGCAEEDIRVPFVHDHGNDERRWIEKKLCLKLVCHAKSIHRTSMLATLSVRQQQCWLGTNCTIALTRTSKSATSVDVTMTFVRRRRQKHCLKHLLTTSFDLNWAWKSRRRNLSVYLREKSAGCLKQTMMSPEMKALPKNFAHCCALSQWFHH